MTTGVTAIPATTDQSHPGAETLGKKTLKRKLPLIGNKVLQKVMKNMKRRLQNL